MIESPNSSQWPKISIVTPNYNYGEFLEQTILSVLSQEYPNLEYIIVDGGSTDDSIEIIHRYEKYLTLWISEKDQGVYDALNKGFEKCSGDIMCYLNSDDIYLPWCFQTIAEIFQSLPGVSWLSTLQPGYIDHQSKSRWFGSFPGFSKQCHLDGRYAGRYSNYYFIQQESTFWRKELWEKAGANIDNQYHLAGDFYLWHQFYKHENLFGIKNPLSLFRLNQRQKSSDIKKYIDQCRAILSLEDNRNTANASAFSYFNKNLLNSLAKIKGKLIHSKKTYEGKYVQIQQANNGNAFWDVTTELFSF